MTEENSCCLTMAKGNDVGLLLLSSNHRQHKEVIISHSNR